MPDDTERCGFGVLNAEAGKPIQLAMQQLWLQGKIVPVGARLMVRHVFRSAEAKPLEVIYAFALPRDAALRQFVVTGEGFRMRSRLQPTEEAVKEYEKGIQDGHLATLARQYRDGVVNLTVGNIRPGETVAVLMEVLAGVEARDTGLRFRFPFTLAPSYHRGARALEVEPGLGEIDLPEEEFDDVLLPHYQKDAAGLHEVGFSLSIAMGQAVAEVSSPSHAVRVKMRDERSSRVMLTPARDVPDRDLVVDVATSGSQPCILTGTAKDAKRRFVALVPSTAFGKESVAPRRVVFVLDRSGSMQGAPIEQAKKALEACLGALAAEDTFGIIAFDDKVESLAPRIREGSRPNREEAAKFLATVQARGGTELAQAVQAAVEMLGHTAGDILVLTDGQVMGTERILPSVRAGGMRLHCLGIGSASQDRFLTLLARETGGVCRFVTPRERVDLAAVDLFASIGRPIASDLKARMEGAEESQIAPAPAAAVFTGTPITLFGHTGSSALAKLLLEWAKPQPGKLEIALEAADSGMGETLRLLQGSRLITDLDSRYLGERSDRSLERREQKRIGDQLQALSEAYGLASRRMSLVAVVERAGDQAGAIPKTTIVPVAMPQDVAFGAYFQRSLHRAPGAFQTMAVAAAMPSPPMAGAPVGAPPPMARMSASPSPSMSAPPQAPSILGRLSNSVRVIFQHKAAEMDRVTVAPKETKETRVTPEDLLLDLARQLEPDGGMPGKNDSERVESSLVAVVAFLIEGHTATAGAFRTHVQRLLQFLEVSAFPGLKDPQRRILTEALAWIKKGVAPPWKVGELLTWKGKEVWDKIAGLAVPSA